MTGKDKDINKHEGVRRETATIHRREADALKKKKNRVERKPGILRTGVNYECIDDYFPYQPDTKNKKKTKTVCCTKLIERKGQAGYKRRDGSEY